MFAKHVEAKIFQHLEVILHSLTIRRCVQTIRPVSLIKSAELKYEFAIEQWTLNTVDFAAAYGAECRVAVNDIVAEGHANIVQSRRVWRPQFGAFGFEAESSIGAATATCELAAIGVDDFDLDIRCAVVGGVDSGIHFERSVAIHAMTRTKLNLPVPSAPAESCSSVM